MEPITLSTYRDVQAAAQRIKLAANITPVLTSRTFNDEVGAAVFFKCENFQRTGSFKFRGAYNALAKFTDAQRTAGVVAFSSGNHAQGIALAAQLLGMPATIIMPSDAPTAKVTATQAYGAAVIFYDRYTQDREAIGKTLAQESGMTLIPSYDHPDVLTGQGTAAKELIETVGALDALFVGLGGGGMLSGTTLSVRALSPNCLVYGVEPAAGNDGQQSFESGEIVHIETPDTIADGAQTQHLGKYTFPIILNGVNEIVTVTDEELIEGMVFFAQRMKIVVEPTGCLGIAAVRKLKHKIKGMKVGIIVTGGNVDAEKYATLIRP